MGLHKKGENMQTAIVYYSQHHGNTKTLLDAIVNVDFVWIEQCKVNYEKPYLFNEKEFFDGKWHFCETFKLIFNDKNDLISIENIKFN